MSLANVFSWELFIYAKPNGGLSSSLILRFQPFQSRTQTCFHRHSLIMARTIGYLPLTPTARS
jgi:hypothetical protein